MIRTLQKLFVWMSVSPNKGKAIDYIKVEKDKGRIISFNKKKIFFNEIKEINSNTEKNYSKLITILDKVYYFNNSIDYLVSIASEPFIRVNKQQAINYNLIQERLNNSFVFVNQKPYSIGESYKKKVEQFFIDMENKNI